ncbi:MAG: PIG-L family deacetylase [Candidatus Solibacter usitatus]|nr:PIG-L family deacetylase [Candidatus Solibacter usitatus]
MTRRQILNTVLATGAVRQIQAQAPAQNFSANVVLEKPLSGKPHAGKVLAAIQPHSDDIPIICGGTVAKLVDEGYTGYLIRATNDDMGDDVGEPGTIGENVLRNEREIEEMGKVLGLKKSFSLNYSNHRMSGISQAELQLRLIFLIRLLKVNTVFCYDPWAHDEENPDHYVLGQCVEAACWMAGRVHDYPEHFEAGLKPHAVTDKYYYARRPEITRVVDTSNYVDKKVDANRMNMAKGPGGRHGSKLKAELAKQGLKLPLLDGDDVTADRAYIKEFMLARDRELGKKYGVAYAEAFHYIGTRPDRVQEYIKKNAVRR